MTTPAPAPSPEPEERGASRQTIVLLTSIGGGLLALSILFAAALPAGAPFLAITFAGFAGGILLFVGSILGALSDKFDSGARVGFGVGAVLAFFLVFFVLVIGPAAATQTAPVCGVIGAAPGLMALRAFTHLRDAGL